MDGVLTYGLRLLVATACGGVLGLERELAGKPAGLRTNILICVGAALITHLSLDVPARLGIGDPARIAAQIVSGIGFLGAGTILQSRHAVHGLTSAAVIWVVAGVGMVAGAGFLAEAGLATALILLILVALRRLEATFLGQHTIVCTVRFTGTPPRASEILGRVRGRRRLLRTDLRRTASGGSLLLSWRGLPRDGEQVAEALAGGDRLSVERWEVVE